MPRVCTICSHDSRDEIETILVNRSRSYRDIARQFDVSKDSVSRHVNDGHIAERLLRAKVEDDARGALDVTRQLRAINNAAGAILTNARQSGEPSLALRAIDRIHRQLELQAKLLGDLEAGDTTNIFLSVEWQEIEVTLVAALDRYPEARRAVVGALREIENGY